MFLLMKLFSICIWGDFLSHNIFLLRSDKNGIFNPPGRVLDAYFFRLSKTWHFISVRVKWSYHFGRKRWPFHTGQNYALYKYASRSTSMGVVMNNISCKIILLINMPPPQRHTHTYTYTLISIFQTLHLIGLKILLLLLLWFILSSQLPRLHENQDNPKSKDALKNNMRSHWLTQPYSFLLFVYESRYEWSITSG